MVKKPKRIGKYTILRKIGTSNYSNTYEAKSKNQAKVCLEIAHR